MAGKVAGKIAIVTGSNTGIGYETAKELNLQGAMVLMLCRSAKRANAAIERMTTEGADGTRLRFVPCDLSSFKAIRETAVTIEKDFDHIDILVNNAGIMFYPKFELTEDGNEMTWQSNHLGPFLLTQLLLPLIEKSPAGRIVFVSSKLHERAPAMAIDTANKEEAFGKLAPYNRSKLANVMTARELSKRLNEKAGNKVTVNSLHPGVIATDLSRHLPLAGSAPIRFLSRLFLKSEKDGAATSLYLAMSPDVEGQSGGYYSDSAKKSENPHARDENACKELYNYSIAAVGLAK